MLLPVLPVARAAAVGRSCAADIQISIIFRLHGSSHAAGSQLREHAHPAVLTSTLCPVPCAGRYQRQVGQARLLGEAYNYRLLPSRCVLDTLHLILAAGHADAEQAARLDPPASYFRIRWAAISRVQADIWQLALPLLSGMHELATACRRPRDVP